MTSWVVVDSGVFLAVVLNEPTQLKANTLLERWRNGGTMFAAPHLLHYEFVSTIRKHVARGGLPVENADSSLQKLLNHPITLYFDKSLNLRAYQLATTFIRRVAYDAQYLALAEGHGCEFWTADERLYNSVRAALPWVHWIGTLTA